MSLDISVPVRLANGAGNWPDAEKWMSDYDWLLSVLLGSFIDNAGFENWNGGTSFTNPANAAAIADDWSMIKTGTSAATVNVTRESSTKDTQTYAAKFEITVAGSSDSIAGCSQQANSLSIVRGFTVCFGAMVHAPNGNKVRLKITDGVNTQYSEYHSGDATYEKLLVKLSTSEAASAITASLEITSDFTGNVFIDSSFLYVVPANASITTLNYLAYTSLTAGYLPLAGGTLTGGIALGGDLDMNGNDIVDLASINSTFIGLGRNRIINGEMLIDQANAGASKSINSTTAAYGPDMFWGQGVGSAGVFSMIQDASGPAGASGADRFQKSLLVQCTTADASLAATDRYRLATDIEGYSIRDFALGTANARTVTLSFWVQGSLTGTYSGALQNSATDRSYTFEYTINAVDTWERKTVTIPLDQSGTWLVTTGIGLRIIWALALGSNHVTAAGTWTAGNFSGTSNQVNFMSSNTTRYIYLTGVQLEIGSTATLFERRHFQQEVALCQRYYEKSYDLTTAPATNTDAGRAFFSGSTDNNSDIYAHIRYAVQKRTTPTVTYYRTGGGSGAWDYNRSGGSGNATATTDGSSGGLSSTVVNIDNIGATWVVALVTGHWVADARF